jgi:predicted dehydrogenase
MMTRWGLIGCGDVVRKRVAQAILDEPRSELVAACRRDSERLNQFCDSFGIARRYTSDQQLIADEQVDAVYIATPVKEHLPQAIMAARAGKHVLMEKPMAMTAAECDAMIDICKQNGVQLGVAYYRRFYPLVERIEQLLAEGTIGVPMAISAVTATPLSMSPGEEGYWRVIADDGGGGALMDIGSHRINLFAHLFGEVERVKCVCRTIAGNYDAEDTAILLFEFANGRVGTLQCHFSSDVDPDEFTITGTKGRLRAAPLNGNELEIETAAGKRREQHDPPANFCGPLVADFVTAILEDRPPRVPGEEGRLTNSIMDAAYQDAT